jgi:hypothetical protein
VQGDHIRLRKERRQIDILHTQIQRRRARIRIKRQQAHTEAFQNTQCRYANLTGADHASGFAIHSKPGQSLEREVGITGALISTVNATV